MPMSQGLHLIPSVQGTLDKPGIAVALALFGGIMSVSIARHARLPSIVLLLLVGVLMGPDVMNWVRPQVLGGAMSMLVGFAVAIILFEGGMSLNLKRLRTESRAIRQLLTIGSVVTLVGATGFCWLFLRWPLRLCILFGTLVIVTGPTVIQPLLRRLRVERTVSTVLEAEGVLIDAIGAIVAAVALEVALSPSGVVAAKGLLAIVMRLGLGVLFGLASGYVLALLLRVRGVVPEGLENVFVLCFVVMLFQVSNAILGESGIAVVTTAGLVVGNSKTYVRRELIEFKEQLTVMFIGMLFVLLAADVRIAEVRALGWPAIGVVCALMFIVRPLNVWAGTWRTTLTWRQKAFIGWIGPRGIVAAAVAAFFVRDLEAHGVAGAKPLQALVFTVIAITVLWAGLTGGIAARVLRMRRPANTGYAILGTHELARLTAKLLRDGGQDVVLIDKDADLCTAAQNEGLRVVFGDALDESVWIRAGIDSRAGIIAFTGNDEMNALFLARIRLETKLGNLLSAVRSEDSVKRILEPFQGKLLFAAPIDVDQWSARIRKGAMRTACYRVLPRPRGTTPRSSKNEPHRESTIGPTPEIPPQGLYVALIRKRDEVATPMAAQNGLRENDEITVLVNTDREQEALSWIERQNWRAIASDEPAAG